MQCPTSRLLIGWGAINLLISCIPSGRGGIGSYIWYIRVQEIVLATSLSWSCNIFQLSFSCSLETFSLSVSQTSVRHSTTASYHAISLVVSHNQPTDSKSRLRSYAYKEQVAQEQYVVSDTRCPALHDSELESGVAGQRPQRGVLGRWQGLFEGVLWAEGSL